MPLHPMLVHFPIALFTSYIIFEILWMIFQKDWLKNSSVLLLFLGLIFVVPSILSGEASAENFEKVSTLEELIEAHETFAKLTGITFLIALILKVILIRTGKFNLKTNLIVFAISLIGMFFLIQTGLKGGELVYKHGVGILY
ncbi:Uncharacterized membrane protein [Candidatus Kryptonium thompsonii]|uniref:Uncharacterized membrane protein n=1 Tax=Candidatus Kryptonium thompsonii TaxID=1633631 RepID=A0A0P1MJE4_9BACT|nr:DUF2231 domain-containing protein [Candidatus Kryptonium thompsoni]CUS82644.1 Uncharacterized membrane protein [Candidatus Kryptonium thompsoni]CUS84470.1 Uncharacterized membrane protein [Candidatus Kryptonium thompsoni]CUS85397.1 Uncharacterized membrane protein [Candidatus Kryptonium thompsoni]CUS86612.1 Uncharacterized membrane protein [Candidatus Kryptonium thompsoni]CUS89373.1 Uncharacterized membrane protein [Candidatus Kryptonium thompsoni]